MKAIILAGGSGTRLWPVSRRNKPKQVQPFLDDDTLLQKTFKRTRRVFSAEDILISSGIMQFSQILKQLPKLSKKCFILEPEKKDTAAAIGLAAVYLHKKNPYEFILTVNSDHHIKNERQYFLVVKKAERVIKKYPDHTVLVGVRPTHPETGYGYIRMGKKITNGVYKVDHFVEKPDMATAKKYLTGKNYLWNPAIFCWRVDRLLELYQRYLPEMYQILKKIESAIGTKQEKSVLRREFTKIKPTSIDYGLLEKITSKILVVAGSYQFTDIGHWEALHGVISGGKGNVIKGLSVVYDSKDNLIYNFTNKLIATVGLKNMIIVQTDDALFVCPKDRSQDIKQVIKMIEKNGFKKYL
ncbi:MAG: sugar phosphate nucleotidyltransferase [Patescibacteria group bacterium]|jgi:mannose-1-phosphate guanylyltransferase